MKRVFAILATVTVLIGCLGNIVHADSATTNQSVVDSVEKPVPPQDAITSAMQAELARSMNKLSLKDYQTPYFISYHIRDLHEISALAKVGALFSFEDKRSRPGYIEVRVGSYDLDNSKGLKFDYDFDKPPSAYLLNYEFPIDDDGAAFRNRLWILTDLLYKRALADYLKKKGRLAYKAEERVKVADFSNEESHEFFGPKAELSINKEHWLGMLRRASEKFIKHPELVDSSVELNATSDTKYIMNSEKTSIVEGGTYYLLEASARAWADDGMLLTHSVRYACRDDNELPDEIRLSADIEKMISELKALRKAPEIKPCTVPAIFDPEMSSLLFHEALGHRLEGDRQREDEEGKTFQGKVGEKILPEFLTLVDDPTLPRFKNKTLFGFYLHDDEGVPAREVKLVEDGILKNYLMSRRPVEQFPNSNGHGRLCIDSESYSYEWRDSSPMSRMANLIVRSKKQLTQEQLEQQLIKECNKQGLKFGLVFAGTTGGHTSTSQYDYQAFLGRPKLVYKLNVKDRSRELVRGVYIVGTPLNTLDKIIATGDDYQVFDGHCGAESGSIPVSGVAPSILLREVEIQRSPEEKERPPLLPPPAFDKPAVATIP